MAFSRALISVLPALLAALPFAMAEPRAPAPAPHPSGLPGLAVDFPADADGIPTRPLADAELWQLLLAHSTVNGAVVELLARCHAIGRPFGHPDWRACALSRTTD